MSSVQMEIVLLVSIEVLPSLSVSLGSPVIFEHPEKRGGNGEPARQIV